MTVIDHQATAKKNPTASKSKKSTMQECSESTMLDGLLQQNKDLQEGSNDKWLDPEDSEDEFDNGDIPISHETNGKRKPGASIPGFMAITQSMSRDTAMSSKGSAPTFRDTEIEAAVVTPLMSLEELIEQDIKCQEISQEVLDEARILLIVVMTMMRSLHHI
jgi:hypothetical protein